MRKHVAAVFATLLVSLICSYCTKEPDPIAVTNVTLDSTSIELTEGDSFTLVATISPSNADNKGVIWSTSDASVARVSNNGAVSAISAGQATITATSDDGGKTAKCTVKVNARYIPVKGISLNESSLNLKAGEKSSLTATVSPNDATDKTVTWTSSDRNVVSVDAQGTVTAVSKGDATITAKTNDGGFTALCKVNVTIPVSGISLDKSSMTLEKGESSSLTATVTPADASNNGVTWITSDSSVVTVSEGTVTATGPGNATITAKTADGEKTATCNVTVIVSVKGITLDREELFLEPGSKATLQATISPEDATDKTIVWSSSDPNLISVSNGTVTAIGAGSAIITVATPDGLVKAVCKVASFVDVTGVSLDRNSITVEEGDGIELVATIQPSNATTKDLTWTTNKSSVATVDQSGYVRAVSPGKAVITVKTANGGFTSKCEVTVEKSKPKATSISLDPATALISYSKTSTFTASYYPKDATCDLVWTVSDSGSIEVQGNGNTAQIKAKTSYFGSKELRVTDKRSGLSASAKLYTLIQNFDWTDTPDKLISGDKMIYMALGSTRKIKYTSDAGSDVANIFDMSNNWVCYELSSGVYRNCLEGRNNRDETDRICASRRETIVYQGCKLDE